MSLHSAFCFLFRILINQFVQSLSCPIICNPTGCSTPRLPCPSLSHYCSNSCSFTQWCHPSISSSVIPFSSCPQSFPGSRSFPMSTLFTSGGQNIVASASASVLPLNIQDWFPLGLTGCIASAVSRNVNWWSHYGKQYGVSSKKLKIELPCDIAIPLLDMYLEKKKQ